MEKELASKIFMLEDYKSRENEVRIKERGINGLGENVYREKDTGHNGGNERERGGR